MTVARRGVRDKREWMLCVPTYGRWSGGDYSSATGEPFYIRVNIQPDRRRIEAVVGGSSEVISTQNTDYIKVITSIHPHDIAVPPTGWVVSELQTVGYYNYNNKYWYRLQTDGDNLHNTRGSKHVLLQMKGWSSEDEDAPPLIDFEELPSPNTVANQEAVSNKLFTLTNLLFN